jgi:hypothetical protein
MPRTGRGIAAEDIPGVMEPFVQVDTLRLPQQRHAESQLLKLSFGFA